jgi:colicin import membrane protein
LVEQTRRAEEEARVAEQRRIKEIEDSQERTALEAQREEEARRVAEKFRLAREAREARAADARDRERETRNSLGGPSREPDLSSPFFDEPPATAAATYPQRVTVLVIMQPRRHGFGGRRMTANPVLCVGDSCYVSNGAGAMASVMRRAQALGPGNTLGRNAGVCRNDTTCVYRGVTLPGPMTTIQPVDMGFLRHDRREIRSVEPDGSCATTAGALSCSTPVVASGYRAWIVPEAVAEAAGANGLERVLNEGLPAARSASYGDWKSTVQVLPTR